MALRELIQFQGPADNPTGARVGNIQLRPGNSLLGRVGEFVATGRAAGMIAGFQVARGVSLSSLQPGTDPAPVLPGQGMYGAETPSYCNLITNAYARAACIAASSLLGGGSQGGGSSQSASCPPGYRPDGRGGCQIEGMGGYLPGDVGRPDFVWTPVNGRYGAGVTPMAVQAARMWCPAGYKLGKDNVCYECLPKSQRKWNPGTKPMLTGGDLNAIRRAKRLQKRVKSLSKLFPSSAPRFAPKRKRK